MTAHGFIVLNKPAGPTSMDIVRAVKRLTGEAKVGHGGTLDPIAEGVLPICFGQATRLMEVLVDGTKLYAATVVLGVSTDTYDSSGTVTRTADPSGVTRERVEAVLGGFRGEVAQVPPMYSALKRGGERLYDLARAGFDVPREPRHVHVSRLELKEWRPPEMVLEAECGRGFYLRSLANDVGDALGCGGHLKHLTRLRAGPFSIASSVTLEELERAVKEGCWRDLLFPLDAALAGVRAAVLGAVEESHVRQGRQVALGRVGRQAAAHGERCRLYTADGQLLALARFDRVLGVWMPEKVFHEPSPAGRAQGRRGPGRRGVRSGGRQPA